MPSPSAGARCGEDSHGLGSLPLRDPNHEPRVRAWCAVRHCVCSSVHSKELNCWVCWWEKNQPDILIMLTRHFKLAQTFQGILGVEKLSPKANIFELSPAPTCTFT